MSPSPRRIAKTIRFSSGGFRYVKSMGVMLASRNLAQVSINLTDFEQTPMHVVFEAVRREAERYGVTVAGSEIVGLIPRKSIELSAEYFLRFENFKPELVLETASPKPSPRAAGCPSSSTPWPSPAATPAEAVPRPPPQPWPPLSAPWSRASPNSPATTSKTTAASSPKPWTATPRPSTR